LALMALQLIIKGNKRSAGRAAARRGVPVQCRAQANRGEIICVAPCHAEGKVYRWFDTPRDVIKKGRGFPPGTLLWFNRRGC
jgi:hypothetical protein